MLRGLPLKPFIKLIRSWRSLLFLKHIYINNFTPVIHEFYLGLDPYHHVYEPLSCWIGQRWVHYPCYKNVVPLNYRRANWKCESFFNKIKQIKALPAPPPPPQYPSFKSLLYLPPPLAPPSDNKNGGREGGGGCTKYPL